MSWSKDDVVLLINEYKKWPCLYAVRSTLYKNKHSRNSALESICNSLKDVKPAITISEIKTKFANLKTTFMMEHKKYKESIKSGAGTDEIYIPTLWYYTDLMFIVEHNEVRTSIDSINVDGEDGSENACSVAADDLVSPTDSDTTIVWEGTIEDLEKANKNRKGIKRKQQPSNDLQQCIKSANFAIAEMAAAVKKRTEANSFNKDEAFANYVAEKMKLISDPEVKLDVEHEINEILYKAITQCISNK